MYPPGLGTLEKSVRPSIVSMTAFGRRVAAHRLLLVEVRIVFHMPKRFMLPISVVSRQAQRDRRSARPCPACLLAPPVRPHARGIAGRHHPGGDQAPKFRGPDSPLETFRPCDCVVFRQLGRWRPPVVRLARI